MIYVIIVYSSLDDNIKILKKDFVIGKKTAKLVRVCRNEVIVNKMMRGEGEELFCLATDIFSYILLRIKLLAKYEFKKIKRRFICK